VTFLTRSFWVPNQAIATLGPNYRRYLGPWKEANCGSACSSGNLRCSVQVKTPRDVVVDLAFEGSAYQVGRGREALPVLDERAALQFCHGLSQLLLGVHDDRTVPRHRLLNRLPGHQQKTDAFFAG
jgi:hypothetical protein